MSKKTSQNHSDNLRQLFFLINVPQARALLVMASKSPASSISLVATQDPPTQATFGKASQLLADERVIPPVGQKTAFCKGDTIAFKKSGPPAAVAGKNFIALILFAINNIISDAVDAPGKNGSFRPAAERSNSK